MWVRLGLAWGGALRITISPCYRNDVSFKFPIVKLLDLAKDWKKLENDPNPFSIVTMAQIKAKELKDDLERKHWKFRLTKMLYERSYSRDDIIELFRFIDWMIQLPEDLEEKFIQEHRDFEKEKTMEYVTHMERIGYKNGKQEGESTMLFYLLESKFGSISDESKQKIEAADSETLLRWGKNAFAASTLDAVFQ